MSSATEKAISIKCESATTASIHDLNDLQGNLKSLTESNFKSLKQSLIKDGLPLALHSWRDESGKLWTVDGHMRIKALKSLETDGYFVPPIPITLVKASNKKEAAKAILISSSRYGVLEDSGLADFMIDFDLKLEDIELLDLPGVSLDFLADGDNESEALSKEEAKRKLSDRFLIPPFTVFNAREGWWQERKKQWIALGLQSELGRGGGGEQMSSFKSQDKLTALQRSER